jgi:hypothetical protein
MLEKFGFDPDQGDSGLLRVPIELVQNIEQAIDDIRLRGYARRIPEGSCPQPSR